MLAFCPPKLSSPGQASRRMAHAPGVRSARQHLQPGEITGLQSSSITYSPSFQAPVEAAVQAKNDAVRAESLVSRTRYEGEQKVSAEAQAAVPTAQANAKMGAASTQARAQRESAILRAGGDPDRQGPGRPAGRRGCLGKPDHHLLRGITPPEQAFAEHNAQGHNVRRPACSTSSQVRLRVTRCPPQAREARATQA